MTLSKIITWESLESYDGFDRLAALDALWGFTPDYTPLTPPVIPTLEEYREIWYKAIEKAPFRRQAGYTRWLHEHMDRLIKEKEHEKWMQTPHQAHVGDITPDDIARAKQFPVSVLLNTKKGKKIKCLWHEDKNPSMHIYANGVHCFSCGQGGDPIDVYIKINGGDFKSAVRALLS